MDGLVMRTTGSWYKVLPKEPGGDVVDCRLRGNYRLRGSKQTNPVAVGDWVDYNLLEDGTGMIVDIHDRRNYIVRRATKLSKQTHVIASNIDCLCIVATLALPRTSTGFIDRLLLTAEAYHIPARIVMNKSDLYDNELLARFEELAEIYGRVGYPMYLVSAIEGEGLTELWQLMDGKTTLFCGHSGVGKSALLNALVPELKLKVGELSEWSLKGKHTTTFAEMFRVEESTYIIDTPGIKEFGMVGFKPEELPLYMPEMKAVMSGCHYANCTHRHEPQCAVKDAVEEGEISLERYNNYLGIYDQVVEEVTNFS